MKNKTNPWKSIRLGFFVLLGLVIYAYGLSVTKVELKEFRKESRQERRVNVARALAKPDIFEYDKEEFIVSVPIMVPCPARGYIPPELDKSGPYVIFSPTCADPGDEITVEGFNFPARTKGPISFIPSSDPNHELVLQRGNAIIDGEGNFKTTIKLPQRDSEDIQYIRVTTRKNVGSPRFTKTAKDTWDKIIETVFLALLATTFGTILAVPVSFMAAKNLMKGVKSRLTSIALSTLGWPLGIGAGFLLSREIIDLTQRYTDQIYANLGVSVGGFFAITLLLRWAMSQPVAHSSNSATRTFRTLSTVAMALMSIVTLNSFAKLGIYFGGQWIEPLGSFGFLSNFILQVGDITQTIIPVVFAFATGMVISGLGGRFGQLMTETLSQEATRWLNLLLASLAGAILFIIFGYVFDWFYEFNDPVKTLYIPAGAGALFGILLAWRYKAREDLPIGMTIYYITRTVLNAVRSVEALIMALVAVIWVGTGPFAGTLALSLHTVAALAKLYSEQVESILPGPIEAITATGATRLQTIMYAVVPQIIPPYISFTMYRWDINVRMSTIIGFVGGGGIGFLLNQNINLLNYRAASAQMVAIAIVVASMDYISAYMRERFV